MSGLSGTAIWVAGRHATVFELPFGHPGHVRHLIERVRTAAAEAGRAAKVSFAMPIPFDTKPRAVDDGDDVATAIRQGSPERIALALLPYLEAGVSEFMVDGLGTRGAIEDFGQNVMPIVRNSAAHLTQRDGDWAVQPPAVAHRNKQPLWAAH
jgi:alkanesulfonate monooxygenase